MSHFDDLLAQANRLLDQRQDPFDDEVFCRRLVECPGAMEEVVQLRAALLQMEQGRQSIRRRPIFWMGGGLAAAVLLILMLPQPKQEINLLELGSSMLNPSFPLLVPEKPTAHHLRIQAQSVQLNPNPGSNRFRVTVVTTRASS
ncbi:MAG: hypothetical protein QM477_12015 [Planctomycetota bacterium]